MAAVAADPDILRVLCDGSKWSFPPHAERVYWQWLPYDTKAERELADKAMAFLEHYIAGLKEEQLKEWYVRDEASDGRHYKIVTVYVPTVMMLIEKYSAAGRTGQ